MRRSWIVAAGGVLVVSWQLRPVHACGRVCLPSVVPEHPRFIVDRSHLDHAPPGSEIEPVDDERASVTLPARHGDTLDTRDLGRRCGRHRVTRDWEPPRSPLTLSLIDSAWRPDQPSGLLGLGWDSDLAWTRIDWAYSESDLDAGLAGSRFTDDGVAQLRVVADFHIVFVRAVQYLVDGSERTWRGWVRREPDGALRIGTSPVAHDPGWRPAVLPCSTAPGARPVPPHAVFTFDRYERERILAVTPDGRPLPTTFLRDGDPGPYDGIGVAAGPGTRFRLHRLPIVPGCSDAQPLVASRDVGGVPPIVLAVSSVTDDGGDGANDRRDTVSFALADAEAYWQIEARWALTPGELERADSTFHDPDEIDLSEGSAVEPLSDALPRGFALVFVELTPSWRDGSRGAPWRGWIARNLADRTIRSGSLAEPPPLPPGIRLVLPRGRAPSPWAMWLVAFAAIAAAGVVARRQSSRVIRSRGGGV